MRRVVSMSTFDHQLLINWFTTVDASRFRLLVRRLIQFITIKEFPPSNGVKLPPPSKSRWWIPSATKILSILHAANCNVQPNIVNYTEFYNYALDHINLMSEYYKWQNVAPNHSHLSDLELDSDRRTNSCRFSYCQYPFILSIVAKKTIMQKDSEHQMILNARV